MQAQQLANSFAHKKALEFCKLFLDESGLMDTIKKHLENQQKSIKNASKRGDFDQNSIKNPHILYEKAFGKWLAMSYALGYLDGIKREKLGKLLI